MGEKRFSPRVVFLLVLLIAVGVFLLYSRLSFTGYVTSEYFSGSVTLTDFSNESIFENTKVDVDAVVLNDLGLFSGTFTSPFFPAPNDTIVIWNGFVPEVSLNSYTSNATFYYRACNENVNCTVEFVPVTSANLIMGKYFQYKVAMQTSASSPKLYYVKINYHTPLNLPISIDSPQNITYNNGTILLKITADSSSIWFYNGTGNETYTAEMNRTFTEGNHAITAWTTDSYGNVNSTSVTFSVWFPRNYYRLANNACSAVSVILPLKTANDYANLTECQSHITTATTTTTTETTTQEECSPQWECEWGECIDGVQTETCTDISTCTIVAEAPPVRTQPCEGGIVTQQEVVETGSVVEEETTEKGFLGVVGSAIATPFAYVFNNRTRIFIFSGILLLVVVGFLVFKFSPQVRLRVLKLFNVRKRKPAMS